MRWTETSTGWQSETTYRSRVRAVEAARHEAQRLGIPVDAVQTEPEHLGEQPQYALFTRHNPRRVNA